MHKENINNLQPVVSGIFTLPPYDKTLPKLLGGRCSYCNRWYFPRRRYCVCCLNILEETILDSEGTIYSFTVVRTKPPFGLPQPYCVGYVDLVKTGLRIFTLIDPTAIDQIRVGLPVRLNVGPLGHDLNGSVCLRPYFTLKDKDQ